MGTNFETYNLRTIFQNMTNSRGLYLCIDALDLKKNGSPNPCMKLRGCYFDKNQPEANRMTASVDCFLPIGTFLLFANDVLSGLYARQAIAAKKTGKKGTYFNHYGGTVSGDMVVSRRLSLVDGLGDCMFAFTMSEGNGRKTSNGAILPLEGVKPHTSLFFNISNDGLKEMCLLGQAYINQYIAIDLEMRLKAVRSMRQNLTDRRKADKAEEERGGRR